MQKSQPKVESKFAYECDIGKFSIADIFYSKLLTTLCSFNYDTLTQFYLKFQASCKIHF